MDIIAAITLIPSILIPMTIFGGIILLFTVRNKAYIKEQTLIRVKPLYDQKIPINSISKLSLTLTKELGLVKGLEIIAISNSKEYHDLIPIQKVWTSRYNGIQPQYGSYYARLNIIRDLIKINPSITLNDDLQYFIKNNKLPPEYDQLISAFGIKFTEWG